MTVQPFSKAVLRIGNYLIIFVVALVAVIIAVAIYRGDPILTTLQFAQVFPEHKFHIVDVLQQRGHIVGMTGDGVNDAPALKIAHCGIAVSAATDAARAAASIVLTTPRAVGDY